MYRIDGGRKTGRVFSTSENGVISEFQHFGVFNFCVSVCLFFGVSPFPSLAAGLRGSVARRSSSFARQPAAFSA